MIENVTSECDSQEKLNLLNSLSGYNFSTKNFKIKPGHRNLIMNLMLEIDQTNANDFFKIKQDVVKKVTEVVQKTSENLEIPLAMSLTEIKYEIADDDSVEEEQFTYELTSTQNNEGIEETEIDMEQFILEEYISDDNKALDELVAAGCFIPGHYTEKEKLRFQKKFTPKYNQEFLAQNPRRRRMIAMKSYPATDEGTTERFKDLLKQSMECILSKEIFATIDPKAIQVKKDSANRWNVKCPLCPSNIKLAVNFENNGKYCNYKRSNFERHLRCKHIRSEPCKQNIAFIYDAR